MDGKIITPRNNRVIRSLVPEYRNETTCHQWSTSVSFTEAGLESRAINPQPPSPHLESGSFQNFSDRFLLWRPIPRNNFLRTIVPINTIVRYFSFASDVISFSPLSGFFSKEFKIIPQSLCKVVLMFINEKKCHLLFINN